MHARCPGRACSGCGGGWACGRTVKIRISCGVRSHGLPKPRMRTSGKGTTETMLTKRAPRETYLKNRRTMPMNHVGDASDTLGRLPMKHVCDLLLRGTIGRGARYCEEPSEAEPRVGQGRTGRRGVRSDGRAGDRRGTRAIQPTRCQPRCKDEPSSGGRSTRHSGDPTEKMPATMQR